MTTLAQSLREFADILIQIEENNGEITNEMLPVLSQAELTISQKVDNYVYFNDQIKSQIDRAKKTIENFRKNLQTLEKLETKLKSNVKFLMEEHNLLSIEGEERSIKLLNSGGSQVTQKPDDMFLDIEIINEKYLKELRYYIEEKTVYVIRDKDEFKDAIKHNKIKSCFLMPRTKYIKFV